MSQAISEAGGDEIARHARKMLPAEVGDVIVSTAGELRQRYVFHAISIDWHEISEELLADREGVQKYAVRNIVARCFRLLDILKLQSVAFPVIGSGAAGIPCEVALANMMEVFVDELNGTHARYDVELWVFGSSPAIADQIFAEVLSRRLTQALSHGASRREQTQEARMSEASATLENNCFGQNGVQRPEVFVSYSRKDVEKAKQVCGFLDAIGFTYWLDTQMINGGQSYKAMIVNAIDHSDVLLFISTENSNASDWCQMEVGYALENRKPVIPLRLDDAQFGDEIRLDLSRRDYIDLSQGVESARQRLKNALELQRLKAFTSKGQS